MLETRVSMKTHSGQLKPELVLQASGLCKNFSGPNGTLKVLKGVDLEVLEGEMVMVVGRSGSGKSTLLHLLGGLDQPSSGSVSFRGANLSSWNDSKMSRYRSERVGFVFQFYYLLPELTLFENVLLPGKIAGNSDQRQAEQLLKRVGLNERKGHYPSQLSGGEQQRAAIARALANDPEVVLCDEPTGNLDEETANSVFDLLLSLNQEEKKTFIVVTHEMSLVKKGRIVYELQGGMLHRER